MCVFLTIIQKHLLKILVLSETNWIRPSESGARALAFCKSSLEFSPAQWMLWSFALEPQAPHPGPTPGNIHLKDQMSFASLSQKKKENHWHYLLWIFSWAYSSRRKKRSFCLGFADKKESSVCFFYSETNLTLISLTQGKKKKKGSGIWRKQTDPRLQSREECLGNQKNITVLYKFLVRFQPAALSWILCKTPGMPVNWKVTWIITGLRPYCDDEVRKKKRKKKKTGWQSEEERKWRKRRFLEYARGWRNLLQSIQEGDDTL